MTSVKQSALRNGLFLITAFLKLRRYWFWEFTMYSYLLKNELILLVVVNFIGLTCYTHF